MKDESQRGLTTEDTEGAEAGGEEVKVEERKNEPVFFATPEGLRAWFEDKRQTERELVAGFFKKGSGKASVTWPEAVDEALCVGWIDGVRRSLGAESYSVRFTPRKTGSIWSAVNVRRVAALSAEGRMRAEGLAAFARRKEARSGIYAYEQQTGAELPQWAEARFRENATAWTWFQGQAAWYRKTAAWRVVSAKQEVTRRRRLEALVEAAARGVRW